MMRVMRGVLILRKAKKILFADLGVSRYPFFYQIQSLIDARKLFASSLIFANVSDDGR
jgi:hypothetical protein